MWDWEAEKTVTGKKDATPVKIDKSIDSVSVDDFDALLIPGGYSPDKLRVDANVVKFIVADVFAVGAWRCHPLAADASPRRVYGLLNCSGGRHSPGKPFKFHRIASADR